MIKEKKLKEAEFFLGKMQEAERENIEEFEYNYSAFLNAARAVLAYIHKEVKTRKESAAWYSAYLQNNKILKFFRDKRNTNLHDRPIKIESRSVTVKVGMSYVMASEKNIALRPSGTTSEAVNKLQNWDGTEERIFDACEKCLDEIRGMLADGKQKGFIG